MAFDLVAAYAESTAPFYVKDVNVGTVELNDAPQQITLKFGPGVQIDPATLSAISIVRSGGAGDAFGNGNDVTIVPGSVLVDDLPNQNQVVIRFNQTLQDDSYRIIVGPDLASSANGKATPVTIDLRLDLGAFVTAVVPQPLSRVNNALTQSRNTIDVFFNAEDPLLATSATNPAFYKVFDVDASGNDAGSPLSPTSVAYDASTGRATLTFAAQFVGGKTYRLEIGGPGALVANAPVVETDESKGSVNSSFSTAQNLGALGLGGVSVTGAISVMPVKATPAGDLGYRTQPGTLDEPGKKPAVPTLGAVPFAKVDPAAAIAEVHYNFKDEYGTDAQGNQLRNVITEAQKQRAREIFEVISLQAGVRFIETPDQGLTVVTGDMRAVDATGNTIPQVAASWTIDPGTGLTMPETGLVVVDATEDWGSSEYGGRWFQVAFQGIGSVLGVQSWNGILPASENVFPGNYDTIDLKQRFAANANDVDLYKFTLDKSGTLTAQTVVARPGQEVTSTLDTVLSLYKQDMVNGRDVRTLVARNDDYYGRDSFVGLELQAGTYFIAVTSAGNTGINPEVSDSGANGRSEGAYELRLGFMPASTASTTIVDRTGKPLDGDRDGVTGGTFKFWFNTAGLANTVFVDKSAPVGGDGSIAKPYNTIKSAIDNVGSRKILRIVGNSAGMPYLIGTDLSGRPLADGTTFNVPKGVTVMVDGGAVFKFRAANIDVGSSSELVSRAGAALQILGTPIRKVRMTSYHDDAAGGDSDGLGPAAAAGQWGGVVFREDSDLASKKAFVNTINQAVLTYGGGQVSIDSKLGSFAPIQIEGTRPTVAYNSITSSAGAAMAATPNSFEDSGYRVGPDIRGNVVTGNTINGLFVEIDTGFGRPLEPLDVPARFRSSDIVYVLQENLVISGGAGGYVDQGGVVTARPSGRLQVDPGVIVKLLGARIELERGLSQFIAEGTPNNRVIFTSIGDRRFGAGGTFDTNGNLPDVVKAGDWGGIILNAGSKGSIDNAYIGYGGGSTPIEGGFDSFNVIETHQGDLRVANSRIENNASGLATTSRAGRGTNADATVFVRGSQPVLVGNDFRANVGAVISVNANAMSDVSRPDPGRTTGMLSRYVQYDDNVGPLLRNNRMAYTAATSAIQGVVIRGEEITVESVWDDADTVHVSTSEILVGNFRTATGLRLQSKSDASLVVKLLGAAAGFTASGSGLDVPDRIGGTVQVIGQPAFPVVFTSLRDDTVGASLDPLGNTVTDTNNDGNATIPAANDWRSLKFEQYANDRNVAVYVESERPLTSGTGRNESTTAAEFLGVLAPNFATGTNTWESAQEKSGDENRRLGFEVHGFVAPDAPGDIDVYRFTGYAGSEAWIDIDKTTLGLDSIVELLDASGKVLARSVDSEAEGGVVQGEWVDDTVGGPIVPYQLAQGRVSPGTLTGTIYDTSDSGPVAIHTFAVDAAGNISLHDIIGTDRLGATVAPGATVISGTFDTISGLLTFNFDGDTVSTAVEVRYAYSTSTLAAVLGSALPLTKDAFNGDDFYSQNPKDAGMRVILPGTTGAQQQYFIRVRSQPRYEAVTTASANGTITATSLEDYGRDIADPAKATSGVSSGSYELRVRLRQRDEKPGCTVRYADIRYPTTGIDVQGLPRNSNLAGDTGENPTDDNDTSAAAQNVGNVLQSDRNTLAVAGTMSGAGDIDWYVFSVNGLVAPSFTTAAAVNPFATIFDLDYGDGFRGDLTISVFDERGSLMYVGRDSNIANDQSGVGQGVDFDDLARGSAGVLDPYIGTTMLSSGSKYYVAVSSNERLPVALDATYKDAATNSLIRLEPLSSLAKVVEDRVGAPGPNTIINADRNSFSLSTNVTPFSLADVTLYVSTARSLRTVDAMRGGVETTLVTDYGTGQSIGDLIMRSDGSLWSYSGVAGTETTAGKLERVDAGTGARVTPSGNDSIPDSELTTDSVDAVAWQRTGVGLYDNLYYSVRDAGSSVLYRADPQNYSAAKATGQPWGEQGPIQDSAESLGVVTGMAFVGRDLYGVDTNGNFFTIAPASGVASVISTIPGASFQGLANGPQNLNGGQYAKLLFAIDASGTLRALDTNGTLQAVFDSDKDGVATDTEVQTGVRSATGLAFSTLDINLWHSTTARDQEAGHGVNLSPDTIRTSAVTTSDGKQVSQLGGTSMYFGFEQWMSSNPTYAGYTARQVNGQYGVVAGDWQQDLSSNKYDPIGNNYNMPGGAYGSLVTDAFSLEGYSSTDRPTLYFNYRLETQNAASKTDQMRDSARVFVSIDGGLTWELAATNNSARSDAQTEDGELPVSATASSRVTGYSNQKVQELFDTAEWRQTRIDLGDYAGEGDIRLRFDFSTAGVMDEDDAWRTSKPVAADTADSTVIGFADVSNLFVGLTLVGPSGTALGTVTAVDLVDNTVELNTPVTLVARQVVTFVDSSGENQLNDIDGLANATGDFNSAERGQNNAFGGFFIDDIVVGFAERGEMVTAARAGETDFFDTKTQSKGNPPLAQVLQGPYQLEIRRGTDYVYPLGVYQTFDTNDPLTPAYSTPSIFGPTVGDENLQRQQGVFVIESNVVSNAGVYGISIDAGVRDGDGGMPHPGVTRNLPVLNTARLVPGVVVTNNVIASSGTGGILFSGDPNTGNVPLAIVPFGRIINNTIYGGPTAQGVGVTVANNAGPTLINNLFASLATGVSVDASSRIDGSGNQRTVVATSAFYNVATQVTGVVQNQQIMLSGDPFVNAAGRNFYLMPGSEAIDSSLNSLQDRSEFTTVNSPIGIGPSPILAPDRDLYGQLRVDDPTQASAPGLGGNVYKDRGAIDRTDTAQPYATLAVPLDGGIDDLDAAADSVTAVRSAARLTQFEIQLADIGVGIDRATVVAEAFALTREGVPLVNGVDYVFRYLETSNRVVLESSSVFSFGTYVITLTTRQSQPGVAGLLTDLANNTLLPNRADGTRVFTVRLADVPASPWGATGIAGDQAVALSWNAPAWQGTSPIFNYRVQYSIDGGSTWTTFARPSQSVATSVVVTGLANNVGTMFRVAAVNSVGRGDYSAPTAVVTPAALPPAAPANLTAVRAGSGAVTASWSGVVAIGVSPVTDYAIQYSVDNGASWKAYMDGTSLGTSATITGLTNGVPCLIRVAAVNANGQGEWSPIAGITPLQPAAAPVVTSVNAGNGLVNVSWSTPSGNGASITGYIVNWTSGVSSGRVTLGLVNYTSLLGLVNGVSYSVRVSAVTEYGRGDWSAYAGPVTPLTVPDAPSGVTALGRDASVLLSWTAPTVTGGRPVTDYVVQYRLATATAWTTFTRAASATTSQVVTGLANSKAYVFRVAAVTSVGTGAFTGPTAAVIPLPLPSAPTRLTGTVGNGQVSLVWTAPSSTGGQSIRDYLIQYSIDNGVTWSTVVDGVSNVARATVMGLVNGRAHIFRVAAETSAGVGAYSANSVALTPRA